MMCQGQFLESPGTPTETFLFCWSAKYYSVVESCDSQKTHIIRINVCDACAAWVSKSHKSFLVKYVFKKIMYIM